MNPKSILISTATTAALLIALGSGCKTSKSSEQESRVNEADRAAAGASTEIRSARPLDEGQTFRLGQGYDRLSGERRPVSCLDPTKYTIRQYASQVVNTTFELVETKEELAKQLNIEVNAEASGSYGSASGEISNKTNILKNANFSSRSMMGIMKFEYYAAQLDLEATESPFTAESLSTLSSSKENFRLTCGDAYTRSVKTGAATYVLVHVSSESSEITQDTQTKTSVKAAFGELMSASATASVGDKTKQTLSKFSISSSCSSYGVDVDVCAGAVNIGSGDDISGLVGFINKAKADTANSVSKHPELLVAIAETFEDYPKPLDKASLPRAEVFLDYSSHLHDILTLIGKELAMSAACENRSLPGCDNWESSYAKLISSCARQREWPDCKPDQAPPVPEIPVEQRDCPAYTFRKASRHTFVEFALPTGAPGQTIQIDHKGAYYKYVFPRCYRVWWDKSRFVCRNAEWTRDAGNWGSDYNCFGDPGDAQPYVHVGTR